MKNLHIVIGLVLFIFISGCAWMADKPLLNGKITLEYDKPITRVHVHQDGSQIEVNGDVRKFKTRHTGHVQITVTTNDGEQLSQEATPHPHRTKTKWYFFSAKLSVSADKVSKVQVVHHGVLEHE